VNCIYEDSQGFIWFGTEDGLNKYDGYTFEVFRYDPVVPTSISDNAIIDIIEDKNNGNLLIATMGGLMLFDRSLNIFRSVFDNELQLSPDRNFDINKLCLDADGNLLVATSHGLYYFNLVEEKLIHYYSHSPESENSIGDPLVYTIMKASNDRIWLGHVKGVDILDLSSNTIDQIDLEIEIPDVKTIFEDHEGGVWIGSDNSGLYYFPEPSNERFFHFSRETGEIMGNRIYGIVEKPDDSFLIISRDDGLYEYNKREDQFSRYIPDIHDRNSINSKALISIYQSSSGIIWIGTYNSGVNYIDNRRKKFEHFRVDFRETGMFNNNVRAFCEDSDGYIWIGTKEGGGLSRFDRESKSFKNIKKSENPYGLRDDYVLSICELDADRLLIGTLREGLAIFRKDSERFSYFRHDPSDPNSLSSNRVYFVFKDLDGLIWVGGYRDLQLFNPETGEFSTIDGIHDPKCILQYNERYLWIGTRNNGLFQYDKERKSYKVYRFASDNPNSIPNNDVFAISMDKNRDLWVGTKRGLCRINLTTDSISRYFENDGLASNWVCGIEIDDQDNLWISTVNGLSKYDVKLKEFYNYDVRDGLQSNEFEPFVSLKTSDGYLLFGGRNGFNMFLPENITDNTNIPPIIITGFQLFNEEVPVGQPGSPLHQHISRTHNIELKYNQSAFSFKYSALNFTSPEKNQYSYILHGFDKDWIDAGTSRTAVYTNIPPGSYTFQVIGSNNDGYWNKEGATLDIEITPPPWKSDLAYLLYIIILAGLFLLIRRILISRIEQRKMLEFERKDKERIQELNQIKLRFFTNISHEFRTPLTLISDPLEKLLSYQDENEEKRYLLKIMRSNVKRLLLLINELMDFRKAEQEKLRLHIAKHDPVKFINEIIHCFEENALSKNISINFKYDLKGRSDFWFDKAIIDKVIFNLMSNAMKYSPHGGRIILDMFPDGDFLYISVSDSGKGISKKEIEGIFERFYRVEEPQKLDLYGTGIGLAFSKKLLSAHKGDIEVESMVNIGSKFTIHFPFAPDFYEKDEMVKSQAGVEHNKKSLSQYKLEQIEQKKVPDDDGLNREKILIVEDNIEMRNYLVKNFSYLRVLEAENGLEGYRIAIKELPDIIVSDVMMPEMNGIELCDKLKKQLATSHIPVVLLTAKSEVVHKIEGLETGADAYIEKPFEMEYLEAVIKNLLKQRENLKKRFSSEPDIDLSELGLSTQERKFIEKTRSIIDANLGNPDFSVESLGMELGLSRSQLFRKFKTLYELKPSELIKTERLKKSKELLASKDFNINEVANLTGFKSSSYFITSFKRFYGKTPKEYFNRLKGN
jgi:signal transduction histidine kinase/ligand-binding sensor domain-containing protein/DNA-binding response OmpR family regulator